MQCFWALYLLERDVLTIPVWEQQQHVFVVAIVRFLMQTCTFLPAGNSVRLDLISKKGCTFIYIDEKWNTPKYAKCTPLLGSRLPTNDNNYKRLKYRWVSN